MDTIRIEDLGVLCRIGVPDEERARPQRLLICVELHGDFQSAARSDDVAHTINYFDVAQRVTEFCGQFSGKLIERLASELAGAILTEFRPARVSVEVKKFILSNARYVSVKHTRSNQEAS